MDNIITYIALACLTTYLIKAWFESTIVVHVLNVFRSKNNKLYTFDDFSNWLLQKPFVMHSLLTCPICLSFHVSYLVSILYYFYFGGLTKNEFFFSICISAFVSSVINTISEKQEVVKEIPVAKKPRTSKKSTAKITPTEQAPAKIKKEGIQDMGGYLIEFSGDGKAKVLGTTNFYKDYASKIFSKTDICDFPGCDGWRNAYLAELALLEKSFEEKGTNCPECNKSSLKRKYYDIIKSQEELLLKNG